MRKIDFLQYKDEFRAKLENLGIQNGDILYVGSDVSGILYSAMSEFQMKDRQDQNILLDIIIDTLQEAVGSAGTLLFPVFNWDFCKGITFDYRITEGSVGVLNNFILNNRADFVRTVHPIYSFMVWGRDSAYLKGLSNQDSWSESSPFGYLYRNRAKQINLNVPINKCITFQHYVEQCIKVPYRYKKYFMADYIDENGMKEVRTYSMYVRDLSIRSKPSLPEDFFLSTDAVKRSYFRGYKILYIDLYKIFDVIKNDLMQNEGKNIYCFENYRIDWDSSEIHKEEMRLPPEHRIIFV